MNIDELDQQYKAEVLEYEKRIIGLLDEMSAKDAEIEQLRAIFPCILKALGNGARCTENASLEFLKEIPNEVKLEIDRLRLK